MICNTHTATSHYLKFLCLPWDLANMQNWPKSSLPATSQAIKRSSQFKLCTENVNYDSAFLSDKMGDGDSRRETASNSVLLSTRDSLTLGNSPPPGSTAESSWSQKKQDRAWSGTFQPASLGFASTVFLRGLLDNWIPDSIFFFFLNNKTLGGLPFTR